MVLELFQAQQTAGCALALSAHYPRPGMVWKVGRCGDLWTGKLGRQLQLSLHHQAFLPVPLQVQLGWNCPLLCRCSTAAQMHPVPANCVASYQCCRTRIVWCFSLTRTTRGYNRPFEEKLYSQACTMCRPESFSAILMSIPADGHRRRRCLCRSSPVLTGCWLTFPRPSLRCWTCMRHVLSICAVAPTQSIGVPS